MSSLASPIADIMFSDPPVKIMYSMLNVKEKLVTFLPLFLFKNSGFDLKMIQILIFCGLFFTLNFSCIL